MGPTASRPWLVALAFCLGSAQATPALAQDTGDDWDIVRDRRGRAEMAYVQFSNGLGMMFQCKDGSFNAVISGLPEPGLTFEEAMLRERPIRVALRGGEEDFQRWAVGTDETTAVALLPAPFARSLRAGGALQLAILEDEADGPVRAYEVELPSTSRNLDEVLTACGRPLEDPRDLLLEGIDLDTPLDWRDRPLPPPRDDMRGSGVAVISCSTRPDGRLEDCEVESEHPSGSSVAGEYGRYVARRWRVQVDGDPDASVPRARIHFSASVRID